MKAQPALSLAVTTLLVLGTVQAHQQAPSKDQNPKQAEETGKTSTAKKPTRQRVITNLAGFDLLGSKSLSKQPMVVGATRGGAQPVPLAPRLGKVYGTTPVFQWSYAGKAWKFTLIVWSDAQAEVFRVELAGTQYRYPETGPRLEPGKTYFWTVGASGGLLGGGQSVPVGFVVPSTTQRAEIEEALARAAKADPYANGVERAKIFTNHRLWYDAVAAYTDLITRYPNRPELYESRGMVYAQLEVTKALAEQDFARADELGEKAKPNR